MAQPNIQSIGQRVGKTRPRVEIHIHGHVATIEPQVAELEEVFSAPRLTGRAFPTTQPLLVRTETRNQQLCFAGIAPLVSEWLERHGHQVEYQAQTIINTEEERRRPLRVPQEAQPIERIILQFMRSRHRGLLRVDDRSPERIAPIIIAAARANPDRDILIVATRERHVRRLFDLLIGELPDVERLSARFGERQRVSVPRVCVSTPTYLAVGSADTWWRDLVFYVNPEELLGLGNCFHSGANGLFCQHRSRIFGFMPIGTRLTPFGDETVRNIFGSDELVLPAPGCISVPVSVCFAEVIGGGEFHHAGLDAVLAEGIHHHGVRNRQVVHIAREAVTQFKRVVVLVDRFDHGLRLAKKLGWALIASPGIGSMLSTSEQEVAITAPRFVNPHAPAVATFDGLRIAGPVDVLFRADGGVGLPPVPAKLLRQPAGEDRHLRLIDFDDRHHGLLRKRSASRRRAYEDAGCEVDGVTLSPLDRFLRSRREVHR